MSQELIRLIDRAASETHRRPEILGRRKALFAAQAVLLVSHDLETGVGERLADVDLDARHASGVEELAPANPWMRGRMSVNRVRWSPARTSSATPN